MRVDPRMMDQGFFERSPDGRVSDFPADLLHDGTPLVSVNGHACMPLTELSAWLDEHPCRIHQFDVH